MRLFRPNTPAACAESTGWLLGEVAPGVRERAERHLSHCTACQRTKARLDETRAVVEASTPPLDDLRRARLLAQLTPALDDFATKLAARAARTAMPRRQAITRLFSHVFGLFQHRQTKVSAGLAIVATGLAVTAALVTLAGRRDDSSSDPTIAVGLYTIPAPPARIAPFRIDGVVSSATAALLGGHFERLAVPVGSTVRAQLGRAATISVIGPARMAIVAAGPGLIEIKLDEGTLVADYDHRAGGQLRIVSPHGVTKVVGTLFSVAVKDGRSLVAVARGRVVVSPTDNPAAGAAQVLTSGQSWEIGAQAAGAVNSETRRLLEEHERQGRAPDENAAPPADEPSHAEAPPLPAPVPTPVVPPPAVGTRPVPALSAPRSAFAAPSASPPARAAVPRSTSSTLTRSRSTAMATLPPPLEPAVVSPTLVPALPVAPPPQPAPPATVSPPLPAPRVVLPAAAPPVPINAASAATAALSSEAQYRAAEADMRRRDWASAEGRLLQIIRAAVHDPIEDVARYELAQLALRRGDHPAALRHLDDLLTSAREPALGEPAGFLRCEVKAEAGQSDAARACFEAFRRRQPSATYDRPALEWLIRLLPPTAPCDTVRSTVDEYRDRHPNGRAAALVAELGRRCPP